MLRSLLFLIVLFTPMAFGASLSECRTLPNDSERLACYDALADAAEIPETESIEVETGPTHGASVKLEVPPVAGDYSQRQALEEATAELPFVMTPYRRNYLLPVTYNTELDESYLGELAPGELDATEVKFQISFKALLWGNPLGKRTNLWVGYTQENWWQLYNSEYSALFRETNYQPEAWLNYKSDWSLGGFTLSELRLGFNHESNGRAGDLSRSWNRIIAGAVVEKDDLAIEARTWYRIPEDEDSDENPSMWNYYGYGDLLATWRNGRHGYSVMLRNNLRSDGNKGAVQLDWTFPLSRRFRGYVQYFNGYGENLQDYDRRTQRIGVGVTLTDLL